MKIHTQEQIATCEKLNIRETGAEILPDLFVTWLEITGLIALYLLLENKEVMTCIRD